MKYFTREWATGVLSDREWESVCTRYQRHVKNLLPQLPDTITRLVTDISIHDGLIRRVVVDRKSGTLGLERAAVTFRSAIMI